MKGSTSHETNKVVLLRHDKTYAFCDTDSLAIPSDMVDEVQGYFQKLSPYSFDDKVFKLEKENFGKDGQFEPLWFYGISAKRYVLYNMKDGMPVIRKHSLHGLGHILNPFKDISDDKWHVSVWYDLLKYHYGMISFDDLDEKYSKAYAISRLTISTPQLMDRFKVLNSTPCFKTKELRLKAQASSPHFKVLTKNKNKDKPLEKQIKPFNFMLVGVSNFEGKDGLTVKPLVPYTKNHQGIVYGDFIDYQSGKVMNGIEYWKPMHTVFWDYLNHPESKFDGNTGKLERKHLHVRTIMHIGKESDNLDVANVMGVQDGAYTVYARTQTSTNDAHANAHANDTHMHTCVKHAETSSKCTNVRMSNTDTDVRMSNTDTDVRMNMDPIHAYILQMTPQDAYKLGITLTTLRQWQRGFKLGKPVKIRKGMIKRLKRMIGEQRIRTYI